MSHLQSTGARRRERNKNLPITPQEAQIIDACLKGQDPELDNHRDFILRIGYCLIHGEPRVIEVSEETLWFLRHRILPYIQAGDVTGIDVIIKVYRLLTEIYPERRVEMPKEMSTCSGEQAIIVWEENHARSTNESTTKNSPQDAADTRPRYRPGREAESR